jgi:peptidase E
VFVKQLLFPSAQKALSQSLSLTAFLFLPHNTRTNKAFNRLEPSKEGAREYKHRQKTAWRSHKPSFFPDGGQRAKNKASTSLVYQRNGWQQFVVLLS